MYDRVEGNLGVHDLQVNYTNNQKFRSTSGQTSNDFFEIFVLLKIAFSNFSERYFRSTDGTITCKKSEISAKSIRSKRSLLFKLQQINNFFVELRKMTNAWNI